MIEEHRWRNGHEKKPNKNYGRRQDRSLVSRVGHLHMVLLNDVQKIVVVPQIQYIAVCPNYKCVRKLDIRSKSMEWSMFLSWCRSSFPPFFFLKTFCFSQFCPVCCLFVSKNDTLRKLWNTFLVYVDKNSFLRVLSVVENFAEDLQLFVELFIRKNNLLQKKLFDVLFF